MIKGTVVFALYVLCMGVIYGQRLAPFDLLDFSFDARLSALGQYHISRGENYLGFAWQNPAMGNGGKTMPVSSQHGVSASMALHLGGAWGGETMYGWRKGRHHVVGGVRYFSYGDLGRHDARGVSEGIFSASSELFILSYGHTIGPFTLGISFQPVFLHIDSYDAHAAYIDIGGKYEQEEVGISVGWAVKHLRLYAVGNHFRFRDGSDIWLGFSYRPGEFPLRFSLTAYNLLNKNNYYYEEEAAERLHRERGNVSRELWSRLVFGVEALIGKHIILMGGYRYGIRQAFRVDARGGLSGFSMGISVVWRGFSLSLSQSFEQVSQGRVHATLGMNISEAIRR